MSTAALAVAFPTRASSSVITRTRSATGWPTIDDSKSARTARIVEVSSPWIAGRGIASAYPRTPSLSSNSSSTCSASVIVPSANTIARRNGIRNTVQVMRAMIGCVI